MPAQPLPIEEPRTTTPEQFLAFWEEDGLVQSAAHYIVNTLRGRTHCKELRGSMDAIFAAVVQRLAPERTHLFVLHDKEEAAYFLNDLQSLLPDRDVLLFPTSYKKPYQLLDVENANVLQRAEVLNRISQNDKQQGILLVTYPEALTDKVINQRALVENTLSVKVGESTGIETLAEILNDYEFERTEFVYEAGQFAVRGGIMDIYSFANELPYRLEFFGDEIESIRIFDPLSQLSVGSKEHVSIIPNVQKRMMQEVRDSFVKFIPRNALLWFKDYVLTLETLEGYFQQAKRDFDTILKQSQQTQVIQSPEDLFETTESFQNALSAYACVEFGNRFHLKATESFTFEGKPQESFHKDFNRMAEAFQKNQHEGLQTVLIADSFRQLQRLKGVFEEIDPNLSLQEVRLSLRAGFVDMQRKIACYTDHQIFERYHRYHAKQRFSKSKAITLKELQKLNIGDFVTHVDHGIGRFGGMEKIDVGGKSQEAIRLIYRDDDILYTSVHSLHKISKYAGQDGKAPKISKLGTQEWEQKKSNVKKRVKDIAQELITLYAKRKTAKGFAFSPDTYLQAELESSFIYEDTPDQGKATQDVKEDMEQPHPMDRLVCGDVGFGKTEVAIRAAFKAVADSKQVAVLVPTTILATQHFKTFQGRLENLPCNVDYINRFRTRAEIKETLKNLKEGKVDILIGTHRITSKDVIFRNLGLLIIDEEQKFGVKTKEKIKELRHNVDVLTLTATPIPRTLHFSLMGARDLSVIATPPPNRQPVTTEVHNFTNEVIRDAVRFELQRNGQVFFVHNRISDIESIANKILELVPDARVAYAHGQMEGPRLEKIMLKFIEGEYDVLVSTNIIESGLDIPNANTIIINRAHMFGLSDLHQMRGRVGRSNRKAFCYLLIPSLVTLPADSRKRLTALEEFSDLGDGFKVAMKDLDIRGAGNLLGGEQSGFISDLGFDMYNQILEEAVKELKEQEFRELFEKELANPQLSNDCTIETDFEVLIPETYVSNTSERLNLYIAADELKNEEELQKFQQTLTDRFGKIPPQVETLLALVRLRWAAQQIGFEKLLLKSEGMKAYLPEQNNQRYYQSETFGKVLAFVQQFQKRCRLKEAKGKLFLTVDQILSLQDAQEIIEQIGGKQSV